MTELLPNQPNPLSVARLSILVLALVAVLAVLAYLYREPLKSYLNGLVSPRKELSSSLTQPAVEAPDYGYNLVAAITYDGNGFQPKTTSIDLSASISSPPVASSEAGAEDLRRKPWLKIVNQSQEILEISSENPELNYGIISPGEFKIGAISKTGSFSFVNKRNPSQTGALIVK